MSGMLSKLSANYDDLGRELDEGVHNLTCRRVVATDQEGVNVVRVEFGVPNRAPFSKWIRLYPEDRSSVSNAKVLEMDENKYQKAQERGLSDAKRLCYAFTGRTDIHDWSELEGQTAELYVYRQAAYPPGSEKPGNLDVRLPYIPNI